MITTKQIRVLLWILLVWLSAGTDAFSCTIFYLSGDSVILAGNNEDWEDPLSRMWFYPATGNSLGWIKFGWGSGFPQGGMNERGLFWDATSGPYLEMPYSESHKEKYSGPIMQKVMEECADVEEALQVFSAYYCEDQYKAQYLLGDANHRSVIVEGDSILGMENGYLILTNFYHSHPELGGYPCWRYSTADEMIGNCETYTTLLAGSVLSATHQEGRYPTQYSQIYDLKNGVIYLFYYHNYEEFILINLKEELKKGIQSYGIPELFSRVFPESPVSGEQVSSTTVNIRWQGKPDSRYEILVSTDPALKEDVNTILARNDMPRQQVPGNFRFLAGMILLVPLLWRKKRVVPLVFLLVLLMNPQCNKEEDPETDEVVTRNKTVEGLLPGTVYYWKIRATAFGQDAFESETVSRFFITGSQQ